MAVSYTHLDVYKRQEEELRKFGVTITSTEDEIFIQGGQDYTCKQTLHGHNDHRIVMALSVATACSNSCTTIELSLIHI